MKENAAITTMSGGREDKNEQTSDCTCGISTFFIMSFYDVRMEYTLMVQFDEMAVKLCQKNRWSY